MGSEDVYKRQLEYTDDFAVKVVAKESVGRAKKVDKCLKEWMPHKLVSVPEFETPGSPELLRVVELARQENGEEAVEGMTLMLADIFRSYSMHMKSFFRAIMNKENSIA